MAFFQKIKDSAIFRCFFSTAVGSGVSKILLVITVFLCANLMSKNDFGSFCFVRNTLNSILCICALNYVGLCTKFAAEIAYDKSSATKLLILIIFSLVVCVLFGGGMLLLPDNLMSSISGGEDLANYFRVIAVLLPMFIMQPIIEGILRGKMYFKLVAALQILSSFIFLGTVLLGYHFYGVEGSIYGIFAYYFLYAVMSICALAYLFPLPSNVKEASVCIKSELGVLKKMVIPVFLLSFMEIPIMWWAQVVVIKYDSLAGVATLTVIMQIRHIITLIPSYFFTTYTTFASKMNAQGEYEKYFSILKKSAIWIAVVSTVASALFIVFDTTILGLFGKAYVGDTSPFLIGMLILPFYVLISLYKVNLLVLEHQRVMLFISIGSNIIFITLLYLLIYTSIPAVESYFYSQMIQYVIVFFIVLRIAQLDKIRLIKSQ